MTRSPKRSSAFGHCAAADTEKIVTITPTPAKRLISLSRVALTVIFARPRSARGNQGRGIFELGRDAKVAREMVERSQRQDAERSLAADQRRRRRADRPVAAADHHQSVAALGDGLRPHFAFAAVDQLDFGIDARGLERGRDCFRNVGIARRRAALAIHQD